MIVQEDLLLAGMLPSTPQSEAVRQEEKSKIAQCGLCSDQTPVQYRNPQLTANYISAPATMHALHQGRQLAELELQLEFRGM